LKELRYHCAEKWLGELSNEPDLAEDTRVAVPIYTDPNQGTMRLWVTLGVRLTKLEAAYVRPPWIKPIDGEMNWSGVGEWQLRTADHLLAVDEFVEVEIPAIEPPNREELRQLCDKYRTKEQIIEALAARRW
jgi:hypothetical protein